MFAVFKVVLVNDDIDRMRHSATRSLLERRDVIVVASVSHYLGTGVAVGAFLLSAQLISVVVSSRDEQPLHYRTCSCKSSSRPSQKWERI